MGDQYNLNPVAEGEDDMMEENELFEQHVIQDEDHIRLVHHFLDEVFRDSRSLGVVQ